METDGGRSKKYLLAQLVIVCSGAIDATDNRTLSSRNIETRKKSPFFMAKYSFLQVFEGIKNLGNLEVPQYRPLDMDTGNSTILFTNLYPNQTSIVS